MDRFNLFLFDMDGTIIDTEEIHYKTYIDVFKIYNLTKLETLSIDDYFRLSHFSNDMMEKYIYDNYPDIDYKLFYQTKKQKYLENLDKIDCLKYKDGFVQFFNLLKKENKTTALVTHSNKQILDIIIMRLPLIGEFDIIVNGDDYINKKPHPECYLKAIDIYKTRNGSGDAEINAIGFEDSYRGYLSLLNSKIITPVLIASDNYPLLDKMQDSVKYRFENFVDLDLNKISL